MQGNKDEAMEENMAEIMTQLEFLIKNMMGAPTKNVIVLEYKWYDEEEAKRLHEESSYFSKDPGGSFPTYQRQVVNQGWTNRERK